MAVYTEVPNDALEAFLSGYDIGKLLACKGIAEGVENSNYLVHAECGFYILTLYEKRVHEGDLPFFLALMEHLAARGIHCPQPVKDRTGAALRRLCGRPAAIINFIDGIAVHRPAAAHCAALGEALALLHRAGADFPQRRANALSVAGWHSLFETARPRMDEVSPNLAALLSGELAHLERAWPRALPSGVIHADLFPDNVFFLADKLSGLIDFYFACTDAFAYDIAICLNAWCFDEDGAFDITKGMALLDGYERVRRLTAAEVAALPTLARGGALRFALTRIVDWLDVPAGALVKPKDPMEYVGKLRFHQRAVGARDYGLLR